MATLRALLRWAVLTSLLAAVLFIAAGSTAISSLRDYVAELSALLLFTMVAVDPELARERARPAGTDIDPRSRTASGFFFLVTVVFAALDVGRLHQSDSVPPSWQLAAFVVFAGALILQAAAMIVNPFFSPALRIQAERGHAVITRGPYRFLRHPGYLAMLIALPASALAIGSWLALIPAAGFGLVIVRRARKEEEFLKENLSGYIHYVERIPGGLFPRLTAIQAAAFALTGAAAIAAGLVYAASANSTVGVTLSPSLFNERRAFDELQQLVALGPRFPGSDAHDWARIIVDLCLMAAGVDVKNVDFQVFEASTPVGEIEMTNIIARIPGAQPDTVILGGHYDTKRMTVPFVGASDGASSTAFLIEMAQALAHRKNRFTYWIVLFDGEEALDSWSASDGLYGSRHFVQALTADQVKQIRAMINVDMIGDRNLHIHRDTHSDPQLSNLIFREGQELGYGRYFLETPHPVEDDHLPFVRAGIPAVDLISSGYGPLNLYWHTPLDTVGKCSATSLGIVGRVLLGALDDLETGRMAQIASR